MTTSEIGSCDHGIVAKQKELSWTDKHILETAKGPRAKRKQALIK